MTPLRKVVIGNATLYLGDSVSMVDTLPKDAAVITDPPYGIGYAHAGGLRPTTKVGERPRVGIGQTIAANARGSGPVIGDDKPFDPAPWLSFSSALFWGADHFYPRLPDSGRWLAWNKLGDMESWDSFSDVEFAWCSREGAARIFSMMWKGLACDKRGEDNGLRHHTTQKPIRLMSWCIQQCKLEDSALILDPYLGSGTTGVAAAMSGHPFIGVEIHEPYFNIACQRIELAQRQERLFA